MKTKINDYTQKIKYYSECCLYCVMLLQPVALMLIMQQTIIKTWIQKTPTNTSVSQCKKMNEKRYKWMNSSIDDW